jgi:PKD repeat protein
MNKLSILIATFLSISTILSGQDVDISINRMSSVIDPCALNNDIALTIVIQNNGTEAATDYKASYRINGQFLVSENVSLTIPSQDSVSYTFKKKGSIYTRQFEKNQTIEFVVRDPNDVDHSNDTLLVQFRTFGQFSNSNGWSSHSICNGLPDQAVMGIAEDLNGDYWIATKNGVAFYDETNWTIYNTSNTTIPDNYIECIEATSTGDLWIGTFGFGSALYNGSVWTTYTTGNSNIASDLVEEIIEHPSGDIWFATDEGVSVFNGSSWTTYNTGNSSLPDNSVNCLMIDHNDQVWAGTLAGVAVFDGSDWNTVYNTVNSDLPDNMIYAIEEDGNNVIWIGTYFGGLTKFDGSWTIYNSGNSPLESDAVLSLSSDENNTVWIGTFNGGAYSLNNNEWKIFNTSNYLHNNAFWGDILNDSKGNIWFPTFSGIVRKHCELPPITYGVKDVSEEGGYNGSINITVAGDPADYVFDWSNGATTEDIDNLVAGDYIIKLSDNNNCYTSDTITVSEPKSKSCPAKSVFSYTTIYNNTTGNTDVQFHNQSAGDNVTYYWEFGDGGYSELSEPVHSYENQGVYRVILTVYDFVEKCMNYSDQLVEIGDISCNADYVYYYAANNLEVHFTNRTSGIANSYYWQFGDGTYSYDKNPVHTFAEAGIYTACLTTRDTVSGCQSSICQEIKAGIIECTANFSYIVDTENRIAQFTDQSVGAITDWYWTFGDGTTSMEEEPTHVYNLPGSYNVCLHIYGIGESNHSQICKQVQVGSLPCNTNADFSYFTDMDNIQITLSDNSLGRKNAWFWDFGDGNTATGPNVSHQYSEAGRYNISLSVRDTINNCIDIHSELIQVGDPECYADFGFVIEKDLRTVRFNNNSREESEVFYWEFDDGTSSTQISPVHLFPAAGVYDVTLTVRNTEGTCMDQFVREIQLEEIKCKGDFIASIDSVNQSAYFHPIITGSYTNLQWDFGDGGSSFKESPVHVYPAPGYYNVTLTTYDNNTGCMDSHEETVLIASRGIDCKANFYYQVDDDTKTVTFFNRSQGEDLSYEWSFGNTLASADENPVHTYEYGGFYNVCLTAIANDTVSSERCKFIRVAPEDASNCLAGYYYFIDSTNLLATFVDVSEGDPDQWYWSFNDGTSSDIQNPSHQYNAADYYLVHQITRNTMTGCRSDYFELINVGAEQGLAAKFEYFIDTTNTNKKAAGNPVDFVGVSKGRKTNVKYDYGDNTTESGRMSPTHVYAQPGTYYVVMTVENAITGQSTSFGQFVNTDENTVVRPTVHNGPTVSAYPNPLHNYLSVEYTIEKAGFVQMNLIDMTGKETWPIIRTYKESNTYKLTLNMQHYASGVYILQLINGEGISNIKLTKD